MTGRSTAATTAGQQDDPQTENLLGALSLTVTDRMLASATGAGGQGTSAAITLSVLHHFPDELTIDPLRQVLGLTSSGAVRLVDRLEAAGALPAALAAASSRQEPSVKAAPVCCSQGAGCLPAC